MILLLVVEILIGAAILGAFWRYVIEPFIRTAAKSNRARVYDADTRLEDALTDLEIANLDREVDEVQQEIQRTRNPKSNA